MDFLLKRLWKLTDIVGKSLEKRWNFFYRAKGDKDILLTSGSSQLHNIDPAIMRFSGIA
jgi:hypothetical protein